MLLAKTKNKETYCYDQINFLSSIINTNTICKTKLEVYGRCSTSTVLVILWSGNLPGLIIFLFPGSIL